MKDKATKWVCKQVKKINTDADCIWEKITKSCLNDGDVPLCSRADTKWKCNNIKQLNSACWWSTNDKICKGD